MLWPPDKFITLPTGFLKCRHCDLVALPHDANIHNCDKGRELNQRAPKQRVSVPKPQPVVKPVDVGKKKFDELWNQQFGVTPSQ